MSSLMSIRTGHAPPGPNHRGNTTRYGEPVDHLNPEPPSHVCAKSQRNGGHADRPSVVEEGNSGIAGIAFSPSPYWCGPLYLYVKVSRQYLGRWSPPSLDRRDLVVIDCEAESLSPISETKRSIGSVKLIPSREERCGCVFVKTRVHGVRTARKPRRRSRRLAMD
jgi:hypothetical protein